MAETLIVLGVVATLTALGLMAVIVPIDTLILIGAGCVAIGFLLGVPAGAYYHVRLYQCLAAHGGVPRDFLWHPSRYHAQVPRTETHRFMPWFIAGAAGFLLIIVGCAIVMLGVLRA